MKRGDVDSPLSNIKPIIISETEKINIGDKVLSREYGIGKVISPKGTGRFFVVSFESKSGNTVTVCDIFKILALPEHFSPQQLQMIVNGVYKDGDKVLVECEKDEESMGKLNWLSKIKLNSSNHITLNKVEENLYSQIEHLIIMWSNDGTITAGGLTRQIMELLNSLNKT